MLVLGLEGKNTAVEGVVRVVDAITISFTLGSPGAVTSSESCTMWHLSSPDFEPFLFQMALQYVLLNINQIDLCIVRQS